MCLVGPTEYADDLIKGPCSGVRPPAAGAAPAGRRTQVAQACDAIYIGKLDQGQRDRLFELVSGHPVLSISEANDPCTVGSLFCLRVSDQQVAFDVNLDSVAAVPACASTPVCCNCRGAGRCSHEADPQAWACARPCVRCLGVATSALPCSPWAWPVFHLPLLGVLALRVYANHNLHLIARSISYTVEAAVVFDDSAAANESLALIASQRGGGRGQGLQQRRRAAGALATGRYGHARQA